MNSKLSNIVFLYDIYQNYKITKQLKCNSTFKLDDFILFFVRARKVPIIIRRYLPDGSYEDWGVDELIIVE